MRSSYIIIGLVALLAGACRKNANELTVVDPVTDVDAPVPCSGDEWGQVQKYVGLGGSVCLVYHGKAYFFHRWAEPNPSLYQETVTIYDGSGWQTIRSNIPDELVTTVCNFSFVIGNKGYLASLEGNFFYEYNFANNTWVPKAAFAGPPRFQPACFSVGNKGYVTGGNSADQHFNDTWEYSPADDSWTQKSSFPNFGYFNAAGFSIGNKGYIVNGRIETQNPGGLLYTFYLNNLMEYDPAADSWSNKTAFPGAVRRDTKVFTMGGYAYAGAGRTPNPVGVPLPLHDFFRYNPATDSWSQIAQAPVQKHIQAVFSIDSKGYAMGDVVGDGTLKMVRYTPITCAPQTPGSSAGGGGN